MFYLSSKSVWGSVFLHVCVLVCIAIPSYVMSSIAEKIDRSKSLNVTQITHMSMEQYEEMRRRVVSHATIGRPLQTKQSNATDTTDIPSTKAVVTATAPSSSALPLPVVVSKVIGKSFTPNTSISVPEMGAMLNSAVHGKSVISDQIDTPQSISKASDDIVAKQIVLQAKPTASLVSTKTALPNSSKKYFISVVPQKIPASVKAKSKPIDKLPIKKPVSISDVTTIQKKAEKTPPTSVEANLVAKDANAVLEGAVVPEALVEVPQNEIKQNTGNTKKEDKERIFEEAMKASNSSASLSGDGVNSIAENGGIGGVCDKCEMSHKDLEFEFGGTKGYEEDETLKTVSFVDLISMQVLHCWEGHKSNNPATKGLVVTIEVLLDKTGMVKEIKVLKPQNISGDYKLALHMEMSRNAVDAIKECSPLKELPVSHYLEWEVVKFNFRQ